MPPSLARDPTGPRQRNLDAGVKRRGAPAAAPLRAEARSVPTHAADFELGRVSDREAGRTHIALLTLRARRPPPAGMTLEVNPALPILPRTRCCLSPPGTGRARPGCRRRPARSPSRRSSVGSARRTGSLPWRQPTSPLVDCQGPVDPSGKVPETRRSISSAAHSRSRARWSA